MTLSDLRDEINQDWRITGLLIGQCSFEVVDPTGRTHVKIGDLDEVIVRPENPVGEI